MASKNPLALPSATSASAFIRGEPGGFLGVVGHTVLRAGLIGTGLALAGQRKGLVKGALVGSLMIELFVLGYVAVKDAEPVR